LGLLDAIDPDGAGREALGVRPDECWLIRPDGHIAAVVPHPAALPAAALRTLGLAADHQLTAAPR